MIGLKISKSQKQFTKQNIKINEKNLKFVRSILKKIKSDYFEITENFAHECGNLYITFEFYFKKLLGKYFFLKKNKNLKNIHKNKRIIIIANGPSINKFDLKKTKDDIVIMVNRSFDHPDYETIQPNYHIIVDSKLASGVWPLDYIDIIFKKNPNVKLILNANWYHLEKFKELRKKSNVFWVKNKMISLLYDNFNYNLESLYSTLGVTGHAVSLGIYSGSKKIYILGMELNGVIKLLNNENSHFGGSDPDYKNYNIIDWAKALNSNSRGLRTWYAYAMQCKKNNIELINLSDAGLFNFVKKEDYNELFRKD